MSTITLSPYSFPITDLYTSHREPPDINALAALDYFRGEKIRKKAWKFYEKLRTQGGSPVLSEAALAKLTEYVAKLDEELRFEKNMGTEERRGLAPPPSRIEFDLNGVDFVSESTELLPPVPGTFHWELRRLVEVRLTAEENARGIVLTEVQRLKAIEALEREPALREQAKRRLEANFEERERAAKELSRGFAK